MATQAQPVSQLNPRRSRRRPSRARYDVQHVSETPRGWRVRSVARGDHVIRIAFPPGRRKKGSGRVVEILHPRTNPACEEGSCHERTCNPAELVIFGNPWSQNALVDEIRHGDKVTFLDRFGKQRTGRAVMRSSSGGWVLNMGGRYGTPAVVHEDMIVRVRRGNPLKMSEAVKERISRAAKILETQGYDAFLAHVAKSKSEYEKKLEARKSRGNANHKTNCKCFACKHARGERVKGRGHNSRKSRNFVRRGNQEATTETEAAVQLFQTFHGKDPREILRLQQDTSIRKDYTALGDLIALGLDDNGYSEAELTHRWDKCPYLNFTGKGIKLASAPNGKQLYALGGDVNLAPALKDFKDVDTSKDFVDLGEIYFVVYEAEKAHSNFQPVQWMHRFDKAARPVLVYNQIQNAILFAGGEYFIDLRETLSPGIEG